MDIALIVGVLLGLFFMIGSIAYALFVEGSAGGFGDFISPPSFGIVAGGMIASIFVAFPMYHVSALGKAIGAVLKPADDKMGPLVDEARTWKKQLTLLKHIFSRTEFKWLWMAIH